MGPVVDASMSRLRLRPFRGSTTLENLRRHGEGVFHVTDDVEILARSAIGRLDEPPEMVRCEAIDGFILADACRWYAFRLASLDDSEERAEIVAEVVDHGRIRDFFGFNRAKHAVVEAAILATRVNFLPADELLTQMRSLAVIVDKTSGESERRAFDLLRRHVDERLAAKDEAAKS